MWPWADVAFGAVVVGVVVEGVTALSPAPGRVWSLTYYYYIKARSLAIYNNLVTKTLSNDLLGSEWNFGYPIRGHWGRPDHALVTTNPQISVA